MELPSDCPECGKQLSKTRKICGCGWRIAMFSEKNVVDQSYCQYQTIEGQCKEIGTVSPGGLSGKWFCRKHWYLATQEKFQHK